MAGETKGCPLAEVRGIYTDCSLAGTGPTRRVFQPKRSLSGSGECLMNLNRTAVACRCNFLHRVEQILCNGHKV